MKSVTTSSPDAYLIWAEKWRQSGASIIGGCCGSARTHC
ncbi:homocysteine S-methyltransferase family protein [Vibrio sp. M60_M31a]